VWRQEDAGKCSEDDEDRTVQTKTVTTGVIWSYFLVLLRILAAAFCMSCNCLMVFLGRPVTVIHPAGDERMKVLTLNKASNSCDIFFKMIIC